MAITPRTTAVTPRTTPTILVSVEGMEHEGSRASNNPIVAIRRSSWTWNGIRVGTPSVKASRGVGSKPGGAILAARRVPLTSVAVDMCPVIPGQGPGETGGCRLRPLPASTSSRDGAFAEVSLVAWARIAAIAQSAEHGHGKAGVVGSIPTRGSKVVRGPASRGATRSRR